MLRTTCARSLQNPRLRRVCQQTYINLVAQYAGLGDTVDLSEEAAAANKGVLGKNLTRCRFITQEAAGLNRR